MLKVKIYSSQYHQEIFEDEIHLPENWDNMTEDEKAEFKDDWVKQIYAECFSEVFIQ